MNSEVPVTIDDLYFNPETYLNKINMARDYVKERLPDGFMPQVALTLGSGGLGDITSLIDTVAEIPYSEIPGFEPPTIIGHEGKLIAGFISGVPMIGYKGRHHFYEKGAQPNEVIAMKRVTFPVYVARALGAELYFATNAAGGLNPAYKPGDLMVINSHVDLYFPNPLLGPQVDFMDAWRFQPQHAEYGEDIRGLIHQAARELGEESHVHEGVYCAVTGPTFESKADSQMLRGNGVDAVGMSTVPEIIVAENLGMKTAAFSLVTNVVVADGTNATSHQEVMEALEDPATRQRVSSITKGFFDLYAAFISTN